MASLLLKVRESFNSAQDGHITQSRICEQMASLQTNATENQFWDAFIHHVQKSIVYFKSEPTVERVIDFIANFATYPTRVNRKKGEESKTEVTQLISPSDGSEEEEEEEELMEPFLLKCFNFFITHHNAREKGVRLRCCQLINKMLNLLGDQAVIDEDLSDSIYKCMMVRIKDTYPPIRVQAVLALYRLQDPSDNECPVIDAYLRSLSKDIHPLVRRAIISKVAISRKSLPFLIERVRDIKDINRKTVYMILAEKVSIKALSISQRNKLLTDGLKNERSVDVQRACCEMLKAWFRSCNYNFIKLLEALDTEGSPECSEISMKNILKDASLEKLQEYAKQLDEFCARSTDGKLNTDNQNLLTPEKVFFWYSICKHLKTFVDGDALLQEILPELTNFSEYVRCYTEKNFMDSVLSEVGGIGQSEFILEYLLNIAGILDLSDEIGRRHLRTLVHDFLLLPSIPVTLVNILVKRFKDVESNEDTFVQSIVEAISDIKQPLVQVVSTAMKEKTRMLQLQLARISVSLEDCKEDLDCAVKQQDFQQASILKDNITELGKQQNDIKIQLEECQEQITERVECNDDPATILKCLTVGTAMLSLLLKRGLNPVLMTLKDELFIDGVTNEDPCIRNEAVKGLGLLSLLKREIAQQHLVFFLQVVQVDQDFVKITAIQIIFDLFLMYGVATFNQETKADVTSKSESTLNAEDNTLIDDTIIAETPPENQGEIDEEDKGSCNAAESVLSVLLLFLQNESSDLRTVVAEGLAKVMITGRVVSANILTRLVLLWYNPITEEDIKLRHCLAVFLSAFAFQSRTNQELVEEAFLPALRIITNAPPTSPLSHINISNVIDLFVQLTDVRNIDKAHAKKGFQDDYDNYIHDSIAMKLSNEILSDTDDPDIKIMCKALNQLTICPKNTPVIKDLMELSKQMMNALEKNRQAKNMIEKFSLNLQNLVIHEEVNNVTEFLSETVNVENPDTTETDDVFAEHNNTVISNVTEHNNTVISNVTEHNNTVISNVTEHNNTVDSNVTEHNNTVISNVTSNKKTRSTRSSQRSVSLAPASKVKK